MQRWQDELNKHPINTTVKYFLDALETEVEIDDPILVIEKDRFGKFTFLLRDAISKLDADIAPLDTLSQIQSQLQSHGAISSAQQLISNGNASIFRALNDQISSSLSYVNQLRLASGGRDTRKAESESASISIRNLSQSIAKKGAEYDEAATAAMDRVKAADERIAQLEKTAKTAAETFEEKLNNWTAQANDTALQNRRQLTEALTEITTDSRQRLQTFFDQQKQIAEGEQESVEARLEKIILEAEQKHEKILELYKLVARDSITGGHKRIADREYDAATIWRRVTIGGVFVTGAWILYSIFFMPPIDGADRAFWLQVGKTVSLTALLISFAIYASKQAALHRVNERKARSFFLQVQAFDPFVENLPEEKRTELKQALSARIFGADDTEHDRATIENGSYKSLDRFLDLFEKARRIFR